jgi:hypothetical protein
MAAIIPVIMVVIFLGLMAQDSQLAAAVPGSATLSSELGGTAAAAAVQAELFGSGCLNAALLAPGEIASSVVVSMPVGVPVPPQAVCETVEDPDGGRDVLSYTPLVSGEVSEIETTTESNASWFKTTGVGQATGLFTGALLQIPATVPVGVLVQAQLLNP